MKRKKKVLHLNFGFGSALMQFRVKMHHALAQNEIQESTIDFSDSFFINRLQGSISPTFYAQLLCLQIQKVQKRQSTQAASGSAGVKALPKLVDEIDPWCQYHQRVYKQLLRMQIPKVQKAA